MDIKAGIAQFKQDIKDWRNGIVAFVIYCIVSNIIFGSMCPLRIFVGLPCPACGLTRAGVSFCTFHWTEAWNYNCVIFLIVPAILYWMMCRYVFQCKCRGGVFLLVLIVICLLLLYTYRMIHFFPDVEPVVYHENNILWFLRNLFL